MTTLLTLREVTKRAGITSPTAHKYLTRDPSRIPSVGEGRKRRYPPEAVEVFKAMRVEGDRRHGRPRGDGLPVRSAMTVAALYVDPRGPYNEMQDVDCWDETRDARTYGGPWPVVAHPPCGRWCGMARLNERRWGAKVGDDGGCFRAALVAVRQWCGVLEHPARSIAWPTFGLQRPTGTGWNRVGDREWVGEVWQSAYGHRATKRTWLLYVGDASPLEFNPTRPRGTHQIGGGVHTGNRLLPRLNGAETHLSPASFAEYLVRLATAARNQCPNTC